MVTRKQALNAKQTMKRLLKGVSGINGIGITWDKNGQPCVKVNIDSSIKPSDKARIPPKIDGITVYLETVTDIRFE